MNKACSLDRLCDSLFRASAHIPASIREVSARNWFFEIWTLPCSQFVKAGLVELSPSSKNQEIIIERKPESELGLELFASLTVSRFSFLSYYSSTACASGIHPTPLFGASSACHDNFFLIFIYLFIYFFFFVAGLLKKMINTNRTFLCSFSLSSLFIAIATAKSTEQALWRQSTLRIFTTEQSSIYRP